MKITYGNILNLPCTVDGWPQATITWTLPNGLVLDKPQTISRISFFVNGTLQLRQVATFDKGTYTCKASNSFGSSTLSYPVAVMVFPPRITNTLTSITRVSRGSPVTLNCVAAGIPKPDISWTLPGRTTLVPHNRFTVQGGIHMTEEGSLIIQNPVLMNSGIYKCNAKNALGTDFKSTYLQVVWVTVVIIILRKSHSITETGLENRIWICCIIKKLWREIWKLPDSWLEIPCKAVSTEQWSFKYWQLTHSPFVIFNCSVLFYGANVAEVF